LTTSSKTQEDPSLTLIGDSHQKKKKKTDSLHFNIIDIQAQNSAVCMCKLALVSRSFFVFNGGKKKHTNIFAENQSRQKKSTKKKKYLSEQLCTAVMPKNC